ncbi:MAG: hypothetical protein ACPF9K_00725 [Neptuniibacter sp.]
MTEQELINELSALKEQFDKAFSILDASQTQSDVKTVSKAYSELKTYVVEYASELDKLQKSGELNELQSEILLPAINEVALHCRTPKNSTNKEELSSSLYDSSDYLVHYISQLNT